MNTSHDQSNTSNVTQINNNCAGKRAPCSQCKKVVSITLSNVAHPHGPRHARCSGSGIAPLLSTQASVSIEIAKSANAITRQDSQGEEPMPTYVWGNIQGKEFEKFVEDAYKEVVHWRARLFDLPNSKAGKQLVDQFSKLYRAFAEKSLMQNIALKAAAIMPHLIMQKTGKGKDVSLSSTVERRMELWTRGKIDELLEEGRILQQHATADRKPLQKNHPAKVRKTFVKLMQEGKIGAAGSVLEKNSAGRVLDLSERVGNKTVMEILIEKHPSSQPLHEDIAEATPPSSGSSHPAIFDKIDGDLIKRAALRTRGASGPSGINADSWRRILTSFGSHSIELCRCLAAVGRRLCTDQIPPKFLEAYNASRLIPLDKNPGVRPIGIGEVIRRIIGRAMLECTRPDILQAVGNQQLCCGQVAGIEHAIHALRSQFTKADCQGILLIDASNAFNSLNRKAALACIKNTCPSIYTALSNSYRQHSSLFVNGRVIMAQEGVTQGDPLAMAMYGLATIPLISRLQSPNTLHKWYADDGNVAGTLMDIKETWQTLCRIGPQYGYFPNESKTVVIVKEELLPIAKETFADTEISIQLGHKVLGSVIGNPKACQDHISQWQDKLTPILDRLKEYASSSPQEVYHCLKRSTMSKLTFMSRTTPLFCDNLKAVDQKISTEIIPAITGRPPISSNERQLLSLPAREGGLGLCEISDMRTNLENSKRLSEPLSTLQGVEARQHQLSIQAQLHTSRREEIRSKCQVVDDSLTPSQKFRRALTKERGASAWLTTLPIKKFGFNLHKTAFRDALCFRYGWEPTNLPNKCPCGAAFTVNHAMTCHVGGFVNIRHNALRDLFAELLTSVSHNVTVEPMLQPLTGEQFRLRSTNVTDNARLDIAANGLWGGRFERVMCDVRVFSPHVNSNTHEPKESYRLQENSKRRIYEERVRDVEYASFIPIVFASTGGAGPCAHAFIKRICHLQAEKKGETYAQMMAFIRARVSFAIQHAAIMCVRGSRKKTAHGYVKIENTAACAVNAESEIGAY